jgi:predicted ATPase/DNA-binding winged helix-turn-helix (wHTH) protein
MSPGSALSDPCPVSPRHLWIVMTKDGTTHGDILTFGPFRLSARERRLQRDGVDVKVGSRALDILIALVERNGDVVNKEELTQRIWPDTAVEENSLRVHVSALRKVLGEGQEGARYVTNVPGRGYCFVAELTRAPVPVRAADDPEPSRAGDPALPSRLERIIGRESTIREVTRHVSEKRFVSVVGPGGMGKTTVAVAVAHGLLADFNGDVRFVDLGSLADPAHVPTTIASAAGIMLPPNAPPSGLVASLRERRLLLVLDSCEHVMSLIAPLAEQVFAGTEGVHILATSREPLRVEGEHVHRLAALEGPPESEDVTAAGAMAFPSVQLFVERATAAGALFVLTDSDAPAVAEICRRLDGIALAIEFAAGRVEAYGVQGTASLLENRFRLLWHGRRTAVPRHRTLTSMLDWSYNLLTEVERRTLRRLSIFVGLFHLDAVAAVACDEEDDHEEAIDALASLVEKSLVAAESAGGVVRYRLLDTTRAYAAGKLDDAGERDHASRRFVAYLCALLAPEARAFDAPLASRAAYLGSVRAGLEWAFSERGDPALGAALVATAAPIFMDLSLLTECHRWSAAALTTLGESDRGTRREMNLQAALGLSSMFTRGNSPEAEAAIARGLAMADEFDDGREQMRLLGALSIFQSRLGDFRETLALAERAERVATRMSDPSARTLAEWMKGTSLHLLGDQVEAERYCRSALTPPPMSKGMTTVHFGFDHRVRALVALGRALWLLGRGEDAMRAARHTIREAAGIGQPVSVAISFVYTSSVFLWCGDFEEAEEIIDRLITYAEQYSLGPYRTVGQGLKGELLVKRGDASVNALKEAMDALRVERHMILQTVFATALAEGLAAIGSHEEGLAAIEQAIASIAPNGGSFDLPEMLRVRAEILATKPNPDEDEAERQLQRALDCAQQQGALAWELRAAMALARLRSRRGRVGPARELLNERYRRFSQGLDTSDLRQARQLLSELSL